MIRLILSALTAFVVTNAWAVNKTGIDIEDAEVRAWINGLHNDRGVNCCAMNDGYLPDDWTMADNGYKVKVRGIWFDVPDHAVIKGRNRVGYPIVWVGYQDGKIVVRCFIPGSGA